MRAKLRENPRLMTLLLIGAQAIALLLVALLTLPGVAQWHALDLSIYFVDARNTLGGWQPYTQFKLEYPPLALLPFLGPFLLVGGKGLVFTQYALLFLVQNALFSTFIAWAIARTAAQMQPGRAPTRALALYVLLVAISAPLLPWRYDLFPAMLVALALAAVLGERPALAGALLGLGVAAKLYPIVLLPIVAAYYLAGANWRALVRLVLGTAAALNVALLPFVLTSAGAMIEFLRYHQQRGLQIESLPAGLILLAHLLFGTRVGLGFNFGALHLVSPLADAALRWLMPLFAAVYGAVLLGAWARFRHERRESGAIAPATLIDFLLAGLLAFVATNKVFSPQYIIWLLPFAPLLRPRHAALLVGMTAATIALFPYDYANLLALHDAPVLLLNARNLMLVALLVALLAPYLPRLAAWRHQPHGTSDSATRP